MARGWESKSVESQMESAESRRAAQNAPRPTAEELQRIHQRQSLELSRKRVLHDLEGAHNPRRREQLEAALKHLEERISALSDPAEQR
jgi:hypothetical protein